MTGDQALAPKLRAYLHAIARQDDPSRSVAERGQALVDAEAAGREYDALVAKARAAAGAKAPRTHVLIVGVGYYSDPQIAAVSTAVHGATLFADWVLNRFHHLDRPLGSVAMLLSRPPGTGPWTPQDDANAPGGPVRTATRLGLEVGQELPLQAATFQHIKDAFAAMVQRGGIVPESAVIFYFAGHGLWKSEPYAVAEDAVIADGTKGFANLINVRQTLVNMVNTPPATQVFFVDACQQVLRSALENLSASLGEALWSPPNAGLVRRDTVLYFGSYPGQTAVGRADQAPFFTQELLACLQRRGFSSKDAGHWAIDTVSLWKAIYASGRWRSEDEQIELTFSQFAAEKAFDSVLCHAKGDPEVLLRVQCRPPALMVRILPYVEYDGQRVSRTRVLDREWVRGIGPRPCTVGATAAPPYQHEGRPQEVTSPRPPVDDVTIEIP